MEFYHFVVNFFQEGGFFLYPLAAIFVVGVAISIERFVYLTIETTRDEIVDVTVEHGDPKLASCLAETAWAIRLDNRFDRDRETFAIELRD